MLPVDLNAILLRMELNIAAFALQLNQPDVHREFTAASTKRRDAMVRVHSSLCAQYNPFPVWGVCWCRRPRLRSSGARAGVRRAASLAREPASKTDATIRSLGIYPTTFASSAPRTPSLYPKKYSAVWFLSERSCCQAYILSRSACTRIIDTI